MDKQDDSVFAKLKKVFGFSKNDEELFVPKELADELIPDVEVKKLDNKPKIIETKTVKPKTVSTLNEKKNIFDLTDISDIDPKLNVKTVKESEKDFSSRIFNLFDIAKQCGIKQLNADQVTCAYYKVYSANNRDVIRTKAQITNKLYNMDSVKKTNVRNARLVKVKDANGTYTMSDY